MYTLCVRQADTNECVDLKTISRFAQLEYKYGEAERGKTLFEGIVDSHPKRWDLWSIYMDMEASQENIQSLRCASHKRPETLMSLNIFQESVQPSLDR